jgi:TrmH family RNA methyltransferase
LTGSVALVLGRESVGLGARWSDEAVGSLRIPMHGRCDSLNLSVAAAVTLYEVLRQRAAASLPTA